MFEAAQILYTVTFIIDDVIDHIKNDKGQTHDYSQLDAVDQMYLRMR